MEERFETFTILIARISRSIKRIKSEEMADLNSRGRTCRASTTSHCARG